MIVPILKHIQAQAQAQARSKQLATLGGPDQVVMPISPGIATGTYIWGAVSTVAMAVSAYHGYKRNENGEHPLGYAIWWGVMGMFFPIITPVIAFAEGFAEPEKKAA